MSRPYLERIERGRVIFTADSNNGKPWSEMDDDGLRNEAAIGASLEHAAAFLCRSPDEIAKRAAILGLPWGARAL
jgi:hypothetical protein